MTVFLVILAVPVGIAAFRLWHLYAGLNEEQALGEAELKKPQPRPEAYGSLGSIYLEQGRVADALPLLVKADRHRRRRAKTSSQDSLTLAKAEIEGSQQGVPGALTSSAAAALQQSLALAQGLAVGRQAATYFSAGLFYREGFVT